MTPTLDAVQNYAVVTRKPFTAADFIETTGIPFLDAVIILAKANKTGIISLIYVAPDPRDCVYLSCLPRLEKRYYDFRPRRAKLQQILDLMLPDNYYDRRTLAGLTGMPNRTVSRYLQMLAHLGCLAVATLPRRGKPKHLYLKTRKELPASIPSFFETCTPNYTRNSQP